jgi:carotenoid cleavage dioxygenase-like enzyme
MQQPPIQHFDQWAFRASLRAPRRGEAVRQLAVDPPTFVFHIVNAYESGSGEIVVDAVHYDSLPAVGKQAPGQQQVDPDAGFKARCVHACTHGMWVRG